MYIKKLLLTLEPNIKQYKDEKLLEKANREAILLKMQKTKDINEIYELDKELAENEYSAERAFIDRFFKYLNDLSRKTEEK